MERGYEKGHIQTQLEHLPDPEHPLSLYVVAAMPVLVLLVTGLAITALPLITQEEVNATEIGTVAGEPSINTGMLTLLVP